MDEERIAKLEKECAELRGHVVSLWQALTKESANTTDHVVSLYRFASEFRDFLNPVVEKVFPGCADVRKRLDAIVTENSKKRR
jgi:hypothetical protein